MTKQLTRLLPLLLWFAAPAFAESMDEAQVALIAASCANCHGTDGRLSSRIPPIAGRHPAYIERRLFAFKHDENKDATIMDRLAKGYTDEELIALAFYFSRIQP